MGLNLACAAPTLSKDDLSMRLAQLQAVNIQLKIAKLSDVNGALAASLSQYHSDEKNDNDQVAQADDEEGNISMVSTGEPIAEKYDEYYNEEKYDEYMFQIEKKNEAKEVLITKIYTAMQRKRDFSEYQGELHQLNQIIARLEKLV